MDNQKPHFEFIDPTNGDYGTRYIAKTKPEIIEKAEKVGIGRFNEIGADESITAHVKVDGTWQLASEVERRQNATTAIQALTRQIQNGVQHNDAMAKQSTAERAEVGRAMRDYGTDLAMENERRAAVGIEARSIAYSNAVLDAKHDKLAALAAGEIGARLVEIRQPEANVLPADVARQWATLDAQEYAKIRGDGLKSDIRRDTAANAIADNMAANMDYKAAMLATAPAVAAAATEANAETERAIARKEQRKERENSISPTVDRKPQQPATATRQGQTANGNSVESDEIFTATQPDTKPVVPSEIEKQYLRVGDKFYHSKNTAVLAFEDKGNKLETKSDSENIAQSMVRIAEARGWDEIKVAGTQTFRKEVWLEAASRGMHVKGYTPTEQDKAELAKRLNESEANSVEKKNKPTRAVEKEVAKEAGRDEAKVGNPENKRLAESFANSASEDAVKANAALAGAAATVAAIDKKVEADGLNSQQRAVVMARVRQNIVNSIERGELPEVRIKESLQLTRHQANEDKELTR